MSSVNLRGNVEKTLAIKEFKRDYSLIAKFFFILDPDGYKTVTRLKDYNGLEGINK